MQSLGAATITTAVFLTWQLSQPTAPPLDTSLGMRDQRHATPCDVFCAYVNAVQRHCWREVFNCLSPEARTNAIFEAYFACNMRLENSDAIELLESFGVDPAAVDRVYANKYQASHGSLPVSDAMLDPPVSEPLTSSKAQLTTPSERPPQPDGPMAIDKALYRDAVASSIADQIGFFEAVSQMLARQSDLPVSHVGSLMLTCVKGDHAEGTTRRRVFSIAASQGQALTTRCQVVPAAISFRRVDGSWYVDHLR